MLKTILHYIKVILAAVMLCSVFFAHANEEEKKIYSDQKEIILEKAEDSEKTIGELKENIEELNKEKEGIDSALDELKNSTNLGAFFKDNLSEEEIQEVTEIVRQYRILNNEINQQLIETAEDFKPTTDIKFELLEERKNVYKLLVPYIKIEKLEEYKSYIAGDAGFLIEKKEVDESIARKQEVIEEKVEKIEEKIEENKKTLEEKLRNTVSVRVDTYLDEILQQEKFIALSLESKISVVNNLIIKLEDKIEEIKIRSGNATTTISQKIEILEDVVLTKFIEFKNTLD